MGHILFTQPVFKEMIWGGHKLKDIYGYNIPSNHTGECWAISAHKNGDCLVSNTEFKGQSLSKVFKENKALFGNIEGDEFPLLVKIIDASSNLSVQVHPDDDYARVHENSLGKTECWYVLDCDENTQMVMGHHAKTKEEFVECIENDEYDKLLNKFTINKGDFYYIPSGTIHAICAGSLIYEAQQSSDITYRVYDYHRKDANGNERQLHVKQSIDTTSVPHLTRNQEDVKVIKYENYVQTTYIESNYFSLNKYEINGEVKLNHEEPFSLVSVIEGNGKINGEEISKGIHFIICHDVNTIELEGNLTLMVTTL